MRAPGFARRLHDELVTAISSPDADPRCVGTCCGGMSMLSQHMYRTVCNAPAGSCVPLPGCRGLCMWCGLVVCRGRWQTLRPLVPRLGLRSSPIPPSVTSWCGGAIVGALESLESVSVTHVCGRFVTGADGVSARPHRRSARTRVAELSGLGSRAAASSGSDTEGASDSESSRAGTRRWVSGIGDWAQVAPDEAGDA